tara:strand:- start:1955 stop:2233 length:279 start_codon:yes stop_codon:yes gene_type:complete
MRYLRVRIDQAGRPASQQPKVTLETDGESWDFDNAGDAFDFLTDDLRVLKAQRADLNDLSGFDSDEIAQMALENRTAYGEVYLTRERVVTHL